MASIAEQRERSDRRKQSRGGRRPYDRPGFAPLILVADEESQSLEMCEAILAKLHFAVAPVNSVEKAVAVIETLRPDVIVAHVKDVMALKRAAWPSGVPFVKRHRGDARSERPRRSGASCNPRSEDARPEHAGREQVESSAVLTVRGEGTPAFGRRCISAPIPGPTALLLPQIFPMRAST